MRPLASPSSEKYHTALQTSQDNTHTLRLLNRQNPQILIQEGMNTRQKTQMNDIRLMSEIIRHQDRSQCYKIHSSLLMGSQITQKIRMKHRVWMHQETAKRSFSRRTCCLANTYVDLFLSKGCLVPVSELHSLGLSCLMVANKMFEDRQITIDYGVFSLQQILKYEIHLYLCTGYRLNPVTYVDLMDQLLCLWNKFSQQHYDLWVYKHVDSNIIDSHRARIGCRKFYELLDILYLSVKTLHMQLSKVTSQVFRMVLQIDYYHITSQPKPIEEEVIINFWTAPQQSLILSNSFDVIIGQFQSFVRQLDPKFTICNCSDLAIIVNKIFIQGFQDSKQQEQIVEINDFEKQTFNKKFTFFAKSLQNPKNSRKNSSDTTF